MRLKFLFFFLIALAIFSFGCNKKPEPPLQKVKAAIGSIKAQLPATGSVEPRNRLEIKPPVAGRVDQVLVAEGQSVQKGEILAWMSSSDRAALLDAARAKGEQEVKYWQDVYKPTPIVAPLNGFIIQRAVEPGQSFSTSDTILVMADYLIVKAQVDETDIGSIRLGQKVNIELDAFQGKIIPASVEHIAYESKVVSNVTIYEVNVLPKQVPSFFRSGMSATVNFIMEEKENVLEIPINAVSKVGERSYVFIEKNSEKTPEPIQIKTGLENSLNVEVVEGLTAGQEIIIPTSKMVSQLRSSFSHQRRGSFNPFSRQ